MNTINFIQTGGVPFTNDVAQQFENAYKIFNAYGALAGDKTIISGCLENGSSVSDGFIYVNNELFYFEGGSKSDNIFLNVENIDKVFEDQTTKTLIKIRTLKFGNAIENVWAWSDFYRIKTIKELQEDLKELQEKQVITEAKLAIFEPGYTVFPFFRPIDEVPSGFAPVWNIAGRTIVGLDPNDTDFDAIGKLFGSKTHTLTVEELPSHRFSLFGGEGINTTQINKNANGTAASVFDSPSANSDWNGAITTSTGEATFGKTNYLGNNQPHNNVQPSIVANYIEWVGLD